MKNLSVAILILLFPSAVMAASGGHHAEGIPWTLILTQIFNFGLVLIFLTMVLRKPAKAFFAGRFELFQENFTRAERVMAEARNKHEDIKRRLNDLQKNEAAQISKAKEDAAEMGVKLKVEAKHVAERMEKDASQMVIFEKDRTVEELRTELLEQAINQAEATLKTSVKSTDQKRLQSEFFQKIQVLQ